MIEEFHFVKTASSYTTETLHIYDAKNLCFNYCLVFFSNTFTDPSIYFIFIWYPSFSKNKISSYLFAVLFLTAMFVLTLTRKLMSTLNKAKMGKFCADMIMLN